MSFTWPAALSGLWRVHVKVMTERLLATVRATLSALLSDAKELGAQPGLIAMRHPWSQTLVCHPPLHGLVTGGGHTEEGEWRAVRNGVLLPVRGGMAVLRGQLLAARETAVHQGTLTRPDGMTRRPWAGC